MFVQIRKNKRTDKITTTKIEGISWKKKLGHLEISSGVFVKKLCKINYTQKQADNNFAACFCEKG